MMRKFFPILMVAVYALCWSHVHAAEMNVGFVNFKTCVERSKQGQHEKNNFDALKKQMSDALEKTDKELEEIAKKLEDQDYVDGLSPTAEEELKQKFQVLSQEYGRYQNQFYQLLNQANYKLLQTLHDEVSSAAEKVRQANGLALILNEDSTFAHISSLDFTQAVIEQMDKQFDSQTDTSSLSNK
jgi:outer membrane protein